MKLKFVVALAALLPNTSSANDDPFDASRHLNLQQCWEQDLQGQLNCLEREMTVCDAAADASGVVTANGRYDCGYEIFEQTDQRLNAFYPLIIARAKSADVENSSDSGIEPFREEMVRGTQRRWIAYRDEMCEIGPSWLMMGSGRDSAVEFCYAYLTAIQIHVLERF